MIFGDSSLFYLMTLKTVHSILAKRSFTSEGKPILFSLPIHSRALDKTKERPLIFFRFEVAILLQNSNVSEQ